MLVLALHDDGVEAHYQAATPCTIRIEKCIHHGIEVWDVNTEHYQMSARITCMHLKITLF